MTHLSFEASKSNDEKLEDKEDKANDAPVVTNKRKLLFHVNHAGHIERD